MDFGSKGYVYAIDAACGELLAHQNPALIGTPAADAGFPTAYTGQGKARIDGVKGYYLAEEFEGMIIGYRNILGYFILDLSMGRIWYLLGILESVFHWCRGIIVTLCQILAYVWP